MLIGYFYYLEDILCARVDQKPFMHYAHETNFSILQLGRKLSASALTSILCA